MAESLAPVVQKLLIANTSPAHVKKRAALSLLRYSFISLFIPLKFMYYFIIIFCPSTRSYALPGCSGNIPLLLHQICGPASWLDCWMRLISEFLLRWLACYLDWLQIILKVLNCTVYRRLPLTSRCRMGGGHSESGFASG